MDERTGRSGRADGQGDAPGRRSRPLRRSAAFVFYLSFLVILFEGAARIVFSTPELAGRIQRDETYTWRRMWVARHRASGPEIYYGFDTYDSSRGWALRRNIRQMTVFGNKVLCTNSKGLRGQREFTYEKEAGKQRIIILGDSFTFGDEVSDDETYASRLQQMLPRTEVINMGIHGYGHDQMLILLREEGVKYEPDIVILGFLPMDMARNLLGFRDYAKPRFVREEGELRLTGTPVPRPEQVLRWDWSRPRALDVLAAFHHFILRSSGRLEERQEEITRKILAEIVRVAEGIHAIPILAYLPCAEEIYADSALTDGERFLFAVGRAEGARCFSVRPHFTQRIAEGARFKARGHWEPLGHRTAAEAIGRYLLDEGLIAPAPSTEKIRRPAPERVIS